MKRLKDKILYCLEKYPETRNSDIKLTSAVWFEYYSDKLVTLDDKRLAVPLVELYKIPSQADVKRIRAIIQNKKKLWLPTEPEVRKKRNILEKDWFNYVVKQAEFNYNK